MSDKIDISLDTFLSEVKRNNTNRDGSERDPRLLARMQNPICQACHARYKEKYPNTPFKVKCEGIYDEVDYKLKQAAWAKAFPEDDPPPLEKIREIYDVVFWAERHIVVKDDDGNLVPFKARWYQNETLRCTARHKVDRWGRGLGKTTCGVIEELHKAYTKRRYEILVVCPADSQSQKWWDEINMQLDNSPTLRDSVAQRKQQPFKLFRFHNGSTISIFTAGSASGRGANSIRSQSPRRVRCEEQDYLAEKDWEAIDPLVNRYQNSEYHGSSTPTGDRRKFWHMCTKYPRYREFFYPIMVHPDWGPEMEEDCLREAKTMDKYRHEYLAEFGDPTQGVFKATFVDRARRPYKYSDCKYDPSKRYFMGIDWNGEGTGTRARVFEFDPETKLRRCVDKATIDEAKWTTVNSINAVIELNRKWHCEKIFIDKGYGQAQDELIRLKGHTAPPTDPDTRRLKDIQAIDFGAKLETNRLVPLRDPNSKYLPDDKELLERPTKPFMVEGAVMAFEMDLVQFSDEDHLLDEQLRAYRIKNWSSHGYPSSYEVQGDCGDHDLDATMLALLAIELTYGLFRDKEELKKMAQVVHIQGFGVQPGFVTPTQEQAPNPIDQKRNHAGIPSRLSANPEQEKLRMLYLTRGGAMIAPVRGGMGRVSGGQFSRTNIFRKTPGPRTRIG